MDSDATHEFQVAIQDVDRRLTAQNELEELRRLLEESREQERLLLAQELHDSPIQELLGAQLTLSSLSAAQIGDDAHRNLRTVSEQLRQVAESLRRLCNDLRPPSLEHFGLKAALLSLIVTFRQENPQIDVGRHLDDGIDNLTREQELALFRVMQQSLANVAQHAEATRLEIRFQQRRHIIILEIEDDGRGFEVPDQWLELARGRHFGLVGSMERIQALGGRYQIRSAPGQGTLIRVQLPLDASAERTFESLPTESTLA